MREASRFQFIGHALNASGPFRPVVSSSGLEGDTPQVVGPSALVRYSREDETKFARRNDVAFYASPLARVCSRFVGYLFGRQPSRELPGDLYKLMADDVDGRGNAADVFMADVALQAKARGSVLMIVDMPTDPGQTKGQQLAQRRAPFWSLLLPELVTDYSIGNDGKFEFCEFSGTCDKDDGSRVACMWRFDRAAWRATDKDGNTIREGLHPLQECPVLIFTESGDFPHFGPFASIADLARRLFNLESELDELIRSQTFSILQMEVPKDATERQKLDAAKTVGETIGTHNLLVHTGGSPGFIAPPDGPALVIMDRIKDVRAQIDEIGLVIAQQNQVESGIAMQMRFAAINGELSRFAAGMEDFERRAWDLSRRWLGLQQSPTVQWSRDFNLADVENELRILRDMRSAGMPREVLVEQQKRIIAVQFASLEQPEKEALLDAVDAQAMEPHVDTSNVVPLPDRNAGVRDALTAFLRNGSGG